MFCICLTRCKLSNDKRLKLLDSFSKRLSAEQAAIDAGVNRKTAQLFYRKVRARQRAHLEVKQLSGPVQVDETYMGARQHGKRGRGALGKHVVFVMRDATGKAVARPVKGVSARFLMPVLVEVVAPGATVISDDYSAYRSKDGVKAHGFHHIAVPHSKKRGEHGWYRTWKNEAGWHTNAAENLNRQIKRNLGQYNGGWGNNLAAYVREAVWRIGCNVREQLAALVAMLKPKIGKIGNSGRKLSHSVTVTASDS